MQLFIELSALKEFGLEGSMFEKMVHGDQELTELNFSETDLPATRGAAKAAAEEEARLKAEAEA